jgi:hypothetical protein
MMTAYAVQYRGFLQTVVRTFSTRERAEQWCRQIGRADLVRCDDCRSQHYATQRFPFKYEGEGGEYPPDPHGEEGDEFYATHCADCLMPNEECMCSQ